MQVPWGLSKRKIIRAASVFVFSLCFHAASAQVLVVDATGRPIMPKEYVDLKGSPYLYDDWVKGTVRLANGIEYKDIFLMYDQVKDELNFTYKDGKVQVFVDPVAGFTIGDREFRRDLGDKNRPLPKEFFEVLVDGDAKLLRRTSKKILDEVNHAVATKQKSIHTAISYYLTSAGDINRIKNSKGSIIKVLSRHDKAIERYLEEQNINLKSEQDLVKLFTYYNSLN